jgi:hypothetical protein
MRVGTKRVLRLSANVLCAKRLLDWNARAGFNTADSFYFDLTQAYHLFTEHSSRTAERHVVHG